MATVYKVEVISHWANLNPKHLAKIIKEAIEEKTIDNVVQVTAERE